MRGLVDVWNEMKSSKPTLKQSVKNAAMKHGYEALSIQKVDWSQS